jgi:catechol 2,3-dioxygenase-like lactoylglutathione lyase family enzyme
MLTDQQLMAFLATARADETLVFYRDVLGLRFVGDEYVALVFESNGVMLRIQKVEQHQPLPYTALGWKVTDIAGKVRELSGRGARFERFPGMTQDEQGIWESPSGAHVAWFKDPDGNLLSLSEF